MLSLLICKLLNITFSMCTIIFIAIKESKAMDVSERTHITCCCTNLSGFLTIIENNASSLIQGTLFDMMEWLGQSYLKQLITYEYVPMTFSRMENTSTSIGGIHYVKSGDCDVLMGTVLLREDRFRHIDYLQPFTFDPGVLLIPTPSGSTDVSAVWMPFQNQVWVVLFISTLLVVIFLALLNRYLSRKCQIVKTGLELPWLFVIGLLFSQSGRSNSENNKLITLRFVTGAWCLVSLVLVTAYSSTLTSFIMAPSYKPLVNSIQELAEKVDTIEPIVLKGFGMDVTLSHSDDQLFKKLAKKINARPASRCPLIDDCIDQVKMGSNVLIYTRTTAFLAMEKDFRQTGRCNFARAKNTFGFYPSSWVISKHSPFAEYFNKGMIRMLETGLVTQWEKQNKQQPLRHEQCLDISKSTNNKKIKKQGHLLRITLANLKGSFVILITGIIISISVFTIEILIEFIILLFSVKYFFSVIQNGIDFNPY